MVPFPLGGGHIQGEQRNSQSDPWGPVMPKDVKATHEFQASQYTVFGQQDTD